MKWPKRVRPWTTNPIVVSVAVGIIGFLAVAVAGALYASTRSEPFTAEATVIVVPAPTVDPETQVSFYDTLSSGQIVPTLAEVIRRQDIADATLDSLGLDATEVSVDVRIVPDTSIIVIEATADASEDAEAVANGVLAEANTYLTDADIPFAAEIVSTADGTASRSGVGMMTLIAVVLIAATIVGIAVQQLVFYLWLAVPNIRAGRESNGRTGRLEPLDRGRSTGDELSPLEGRAPRRRVRAGRADG